MKTTPTETKKSDTGTEPTGDITPAEVNVADVEITDTENQATIADPLPEGKIKGKKKAPPKPSPTVAQKRRSGGKKTASIKTPTKNKKTPTNVQKADTAPKAPGKRPKKLTKAATISELSDAFITHLGSQGKRPGTLFGYTLELKLAQSVLGEDTRVANLTEKKVREYFLSDRMTLRRNGERKAEVGIAKTRRVFRMALEWAEETGLVVKAPIPEMKKPDKSGK